MAPRAKISQIAGRFTSLLRRGISTSQSPKSLPLESFLHRRKFLEDHTLFFKDEKFAKFLAISDFAEIKHDVNTKRLYVKNHEELRSKYFSVFTEGNIEEFQDFVDEMLVVKQRISDITDIDTKPVIFFHGADKEPCKKKILVYDERRNLSMPIYASRRDHLRFFTNYFELFMFDWDRYTLLEKYFTQAGFDPKIFARLKMDFELESGAARFARDGAVIFGNNVFHPAMKVAAYDSGATFGSNGQIVGNKTMVFQNAALADMLKTGFNVQKMPFFLEGGNSVFDEQRNILYICVSDLYFSENDKFTKASVLDEDDALRSISNYDAYCDFIKNWGKSKGVEIKVIHRNTAKYPTESIYHLDTFFNFANGYLFIYKDAINEKNCQELQETYGDKIIEVSKDDWKALATNFVAINKNTLLFGGPVSEKFLENVRNAGFNYIVSPTHLGTHKNDGVRCLTTEATPEMMKPEILIPTPIQTNSVVEMARIDEGQRRAVAALKNLHNRR